MSEFIAHCIERHGESARVEADQEYDYLRCLAMAALNHTRLVAMVHARLGIARNFTRLDGRVIRLDYDRTSAVQEAIDAMELSAEASAEVVAIARDLMSRGA